MPNFWVYILHCQNNAFYTGYTIDLLNRYRAHVEGRAAKYTRSFKPLGLLAVWPIYGTKAQAMQIERFIKQLKRKEKQQIIGNPSRLADLILESLIN